MLRFDVLQNDWVILAILGGIALVFYTAIAYLDMWTPRKMKDGKTERGWLTWWQGIPWVLKVTYAALIIFVVIYTIYRAIVPPNW